MPMVRVSNGGTAEKIPFSFNISRNGYANTPITFSDSYSTIPVIAYRITNSTVSAIALWDESLSTTGFTLRARNANNYDYTVEGYALVSPS